MKAFALLCVIGFFLLSQFDRSEFYEVAAQQLLQIVVNRKSHLDEARPSPFKVQEIKLQGLENPRALFFCDDVHGWVAGGNKVYKTDDGGRTWKDMGLAAPPGAHVQQILFLNPSLGWIVLQKEAPYVLDNREYKAWLFHTGDGGQSWSSQYQDQQVAVTQLAFSDEQTGWLVGIKYVGLTGVTYTPLALRTNDHGRHWSDVSEGLIRITSDKRDVLGAPVNDSIMGIIPKGPLTAEVVTGRMRIIKTADGGKSWRRTTDLGEEHFWLGIKGFGGTENDLWIAGSMDDEEGIAGELTVGEFGNPWVRYGLGGVFFSDALALSRREFLACGYIRSIEETSEFQNGAIVYSADGGNSWSVVYRNTKVKKISQLAAISSKEIWAVGDDGLILRLRRSSSSLTAVAGSK